MAAPTSEAEFRAAINEEERQARAAAEMFAQACQAGDAELLYEAADRLNLTCDGWRLAFLKVKRLAAVTSALQEAFLTIWVESKHLALTAGDHRVVADALRVLMPPYEGCTVRLFRGASSHERRRRIYGLSWSGDADVADGFARKWQAADEGGVLLETLVPPNAVISAPGGHYEEREYLVDRRYLKAVNVARRYQGPAVTSAERARVAAKNIIRI